MFGVLVFIFRVPCELGSKACVGSLGFSRKSELPVMERLKILCAEQRPSSGGCPSLGERRTEDHCDFNHIPLLIQSLFN